MTVYIVSRHPGAIEWLRRALATPTATVLDHVDGQEFAPGDVVAGVLPLWLASKACAAGARVLSLDFSLSRSQRGRELDADELQAAGARLVPYRVEDLRCVPTST